jgi:hypothetical protein
MNKNKDLMEKLSAEKFITFKVNDLDGEHEFLISTIREEDFDIAMKIEKIRASGEMTKELLDLTNELAFRLLKRASDNDAIPDETLKKFSSKYKEAIFSAISEDLEELEGVKGDIRKKQEELLANATGKGTQ